MKRLLLLAFVLIASPVLAQGNNVRLGPNALGTAGSGTVGADGNIAVGKDACENAGANSFAVCLGHEAGKSLSGAGQVAIGAYALHNGANAYYNVAIGLEAGRYITTGTYNTLAGWGIGINLTTGSHNSAFGHDALKIATTQTYNSAFGKESQFHTSGSENATFGASTMGNTSTAGSQNSFFGTRAGMAAYSNGAVGVGYEAGYDSGSYSVHLGNQAGKGSARANSLFIANNASSPLIYGEFDNNRVVIGGGASESGVTFLVNGTTGGVRVPRLTNIQEAAISPSAGTIIYNTDLSRLRVQSGGVWRSIALEP